MYFERSYLWQLSWLQPEKNQTTGENSSAESEPISGAYEQACSRMNGRFLAGEQPQFVFSAGEAVLIVTTLRLIWIESSELGLERLQASLPLRQIKTVEIRQTKEDRLHPAVLRLGYGENRMLSCQFGTDFPPEQLALLEAMILQKLM